MVARQPERAQVEQPRRDDRPPAPDFGDVGQVEVEAQWTWIDRIRAAWAEKAMSPKPYPAGTWGPSAAIALTERDGVTWHE